jgi:hypothetical protein
MQRQQATVDLGLTYWRPDKQVANIKLVQNDWIELCCHKHTDSAVIDYNPLDVVDMVSQCRRIIPNW